MELTARELPKILEYYKVDKLGLIFDGFEPVNPDKSPPLMQDISASGDISFD